MNRIVAGWLPGTLPRDGLLVFDTTSLQSAARPLPSALHEALVGENSTDLLLGSERSLPLNERRRLQSQRNRRAWGARWGHATPTYAQPRKLIGGWHVHTTVTVGQPDQLPRPPTLLVAIAITPAAGYSAATMLKTILRFVEERPGGHLEVVADRDYSKSHDLWQHLRESRHGFVFDLRADQLPPRGAYKGALLLQGSAYCPATPQPLRNPGARPLAQENGAPNPKYEAWRELIDRRAVYLAAVRSVRDNGLNVSCPHGRTVQCTLRAEVDPRGRLPIVVDPPAAEHAPPICRQTTVFIPDRANPLRQTYQWALRKWESRFSTGRSAIEGVHGELKGPGGLGLSRWTTRSNRIDVVGLLVALMGALYNLHRIRRWIHENPESAIAQDLANDLLFCDDREAETWLFQELRQ